MKKNSLVLILFIFLYACVPQTTSTLEPTFTYTPTEKPFIPTLENTPIPEPQISYDLRNPNSVKETITGIVKLDEVNKPIGPLEYRFVVITDNSLRERPANQQDFGKVTFNPVFENSLRNKENAPDALATALTWAFYRCWQENIDDPIIKKQRADINFGTYIQMLIEAEQSGDYNNVLFNLFANDMSTIEYDESFINNISPFNPTIVFIDPIGTESLQNMERLSIENTDLSQYGLGVLNETDSEGKEVKKLFIFNQGVNFANGNSAVSYALRESLTRMYTKGYDEIVVMNPRENSPTDPFIDKVLIYEVSTNYYYSAIHPFFKP
ncbi:MAG TPA: hypothetical protein DHW49_10350 [Anaerolineae bacterium]|nr:hypothetical protein [Anaerolineae bacterium]